MAPDVLPDGQQRAVRVEQAGRVHAAGLREDGLPLAQQVGQTAYDVRLGQPARPAPAGLTVSAASMLSLPQTPHAEEPVAWVVCR